jgi:hypothetical protein
VHTPRNVSTSTTAIDYSVCGAHSESLVQQSTQSQDYAQCCVGLCHFA